MREHGLEVAERLGHRVELDDGPSFRMPTLEVLAEHEGGEGVDRPHRPDGPRDAQRDAVLVAQVLLKLGESGVDSAAKLLHRLRDRMDADAAGEPIALGVVTASGYGYVRKDGLAVVPIGALTL